MPGGSELLSTVGVALRRSSALVVVVTPAALTSQHVGDEVDAFVHNGRPLVPVFLDLSLRSVGEGRTLAHLQKRVWIDEHPDALASAPSHQTLDKLRTTFTFVRRARIRAAALATTAGVFGLVAAFAWWQQNLAASEARRALSGRLGAEAALAAQWPGPANGYIDRAALLAVQAHRTLPGLESTGSMLRVLEARPTMVQVLFDRRVDVLHAGFDRDGTSVTTVDRSLRVLTRQLSDPAAAIAAVELGGHATGVTGGIAATCGSSGALFVAVGRRLVIIARRGSAVTEETRYPEEITAVACSQDQRLLAVGFNGTIDVLTADSLTAPPLHRNDSVQVVLGIWPSMPTEQP